MHGSSCERPPRFFPYSLSLSLSHTLLPSVFRSLNECEGYARGKRPHKVNRPQPPTWLSLSSRTPISSQPQFLSSPLYDTRFAHSAPFIQIGQRTTHQHQYPHHLHEQHNKTWKYLWTLPLQKLFRDFTSSLLLLLSSLASISYLCEDSMCKAE